MWKAPPPSRWRRKSANALARSRAVTGQKHVADAGRARAVGSILNVVPIVPTVHVGHHHIYLPFEVFEVKIALIAHGVGIAVVGHRRSDSPDSRNGQSIHVDIIEQNLVGVSRPLPNSSGSSTSSPDPRGRRRRLLEVQSVGSLVAPRMQTRQKNFSREFQSSAVQQKRNCYQQLTR